MKPDVSVVIVADYAVGTPEMFAGLRTALRASAQQRFAGSVEFLLVESAFLRDRIPHDLKTILPGLRVVCADAEDSFTLRNVGTHAAAADVVAFLDPDCVPDRDWLQALVAALNAHPEIAVVSGHTTYGGTGLLQRTLSLLSRAYVARGEAGEIRHISNNNAAFRKDVLRSHPFPVSASPFVSALHAGAFLRDGARLWHEPRAYVTHAYGGWAMERDVSRNAGWATIAIRQVDSQARLAWLLRFGAASIPVFVLACFARSCARVLRYHRRYALAPYEIPFAIGVAALTSLMQVPGMRAALHGEPPGDTHYR